MTTKNTDSEKSFAIRDHWIANLLAWLSLFALIAIIAYGQIAGAQTQLLNVSYDPTRELYEAYNPLFAKYWQAKTGQTLVVRQSHGGSGKQAHAVIDGLEADVVTLALGYDINAIAKTGLIAPNWATRLPHSSAPYTSTIVLLVRKGNPKKIHDWSDVVRPGVSVITANPKTSGGARWVYLAAYGYALDRPHGTDATARAFVQQLYKNVPVLDAGARGATTTFLERGIGDVLLTWEDEAILAANTVAPGKVEVVYPSESVTAEPVASVVDKIVDKHHTRYVATAYLQYLESPEAQEVIAQHFYRPRNAKVAAKYAKRFPVLKQFTVARFGGWDVAQKTHFADGGVFDQLYSR